MPKDPHLSQTQELEAILEETRRRNLKFNSDDPAVIADNYDQTPASAPKKDDDYVDITAAKKPSSERYVDINSPQSRSRSKQPVAEQKKKKKSHVGLVIGIIAGVIVLAAAGFFVWYLNSGSSTFASNVSVNGVSIAGMNTTEAKAALAGEESRLADKIYFDIDVNGEKETLTKDNFKYSFNTDKILADAKAYSEEKGFKTGEKNYTIEMTVDPDSCKEDVDAIAKKHKKKPTDAYVTDYDSSGSGTFTYKSEIQGMNVKADELMDEISSYVKAKKLNAKITAPVTTVDPKITKAFLESHIKKLSEFTTTSTNSASGNNNMKVSLGACNNSIIDPGETWSFNECTGDSNQESNGYQPAGVIVEGRHETGVGGGICQSSTTIYNAAAMCGMQIVERSCHYYPSAYVDAGRDATVDYGNLDLQLKNPFSTQLFMKCYMDGVVLHCEMYGVEQEDFDEIKIVVSDPSYTSGGFKVTTKRVYYKDGEKVKTDDLPSSSYHTSAPSSNSGGSGSSNSGSSGSSGNSGGSNSGANQSGGQSDSGNADSGADSGSSGSGDAGSGDSGGNADSGSADAGSDGGGGEAEGGA